jgi:hypothetical protein
MVASAIEEQSSVTKEIAENIQQKTFYKKGTNIIHRIGSFAVELPGGKGSYNQNNKLHRLDGPSIINKGDADDYYFIEGEKYSEIAYWNHPLVDKSKKHLYVKSNTDTVKTAVSNLENCIKENVKHTVANEPGYLFFDGQKFATQTITNNSQLKKEDKVMNTLTANATRGFARVLSTKISKYVKNALVKLLDDFSDEEVSTIRKFLDSQIGELMISGVIGTVLPNLNMLPDSVLNSEHYQLISEEFRVNAFAIGEEQLLEKSAIIAQHLINPLMNSLAILPGMKDNKAFEQIRVAVKSVEEGDDNVVDLFEKVSKAQAHI